MEFVRSRVYQKSLSKSLRLTCTLHNTHIYFNDELPACIKNAMCSCSFAAIKFIYCVQKNMHGRTHKNLPLRNGKEILALF
jgi:hypothetical protein